jgi:putative membrane protein
MKKISLSGLLIAAIIFSQSCNSPEKRALKNGSIEKTGSGIDPKRDTGFNKKTDEPKDQNILKNLRDYPNESHADSDDAHFMKEAALGGMMEIDLGKSAQKSVNEKVKLFAMQMVKDHEKISKELKDLAFELEILLPEAYHSDQREHIETMKKLNGTDFDKHYIDMMVKDHQKTIALFKWGADSRNEQVKKFAEKTLPLISRHFRSAQLIQQELK